MKKHLLISWKKENQFLRTAHVAQRTRERGLLARPMRGGGPRRGGLRASTYAKTPLDYEQNNPQSMLLFLETALMQKNPQTFLRFTTVRPSAIPACSGAVRSGTGAYAGHIGPLLTWLAHLGFDARRWAAVARCSMRTRTTQWQWQHRDARQLWWTRRQRSAGQGRAMMA